MDLEELEDIKLDIKEVFEEEGFDTVYRELNTDDSNIDTDFGIIKTKRYVDTPIKAAYVFDIKRKKLDKDSSEFIPMKGGTLYLSTLIVEDLGLTIRSQLGSFIIQGAEYEIQSVEYLPEILDTSVVHKLKIERLKPVEGSQ